MRLAHLLSDWLAANPGRPPPELVLEELPAVRVEICDDWSGDDQVRVPSQRRCIMYGSTLPQVLMLTSRPVPDLSVCSGRHLLGCNRAISLAGHPSCPLE